jgi:rhamnosyltransferase
LVDKDLNPMKNIYINPRLTFGEALTYQFIGGCTMVLNQSLRDIIIKYTPNYQPMHDVWIYSIAQAIGAHIFFDPQPHILYRQHSHNAIGQGYSRFKEWKRRWKRISNSEHERLKRAKELKIGYYKMISKENKSILDKAILSGEGNLWQRIIASSDKRLKCSSKTTYVLFRLSAIFKTF